MKKEQRHAQKSWSQVGHRHSDGVAPTGNSSLELDGSIGERSLGVGSLRLKPLGQEAAGASFANSPVPILKVCTGRCCHPSEPHPGGKTWSLPMLHQVLDVAVLINLRLSLLRASLVVHEGELYG